MFYIPAKASRFKYSLRCLTVSILLLTHAGAMPGTGQQVERLFQMLKGPDSTTDVCWCNT
ncbi:hypothetical protein JAAARDRAFT_201365 [Jaapia argillacea MUCL 33604]|uniref:Uncharacterized protein n=1 Tax=Jaapia argillacea MUCL 33604 TaxID=933084 RepID=A0A067PD08_9AGAM|nr:hypothetical protein JAAARDRAFT_201365 [Jaapia argillacea MUCL 33604]